MVTEKRKNIRSFNGYKKRNRIYQIMSYLFTGISEFTLIKSEKKIITPSLISSKDSKILFNSRADNLKML